VSYRLYIYIFRSCRNRCFFASNRCFFRLGSSRFRRLVRIVFVVSIVHLHLPLVPESLFFRLESYRLRRIDCTSISSARVGSRFPSPRTVSYRSVVNHRPFEIAVSSTHSHISQPHYIQQTPLHLASGDTVTSYSSSSCGTQVVDSLSASGVSVYVCKSKRYHIDDLLVYTPRRVADLGETDSIPDGGIHKGSHGCSGSLRSRTTRISPKHVIGRVGRVGCGVIWDGSSVDGCCLDLVCFYISCFTACSHGRYSA
jgi:hypothetical protein